MQALLSSISAILLMLLLVQCQSPAARLDEGVPVSPTHDTPLMSEEDAPTPVPAPDAQSVSGEDPPTVVSTPDTLIEQSPPLVTPLPGGQSAPEEEAPPVPNYPDAQLVREEAEYDDVHVRELVTDDPPGQVIAWYKPALQRAGWSLDLEDTDLEHDQGLTVGQSRTADGPVYTAHISAETLESGQTRITVRIITQFPL